jgi:hypothetical protein
MHYFAVLRMYGGGGIRKLYGKAGVGMHVTPAPFLRSRHVHLLGGHEQCALRNIRLFRSSGDASSCHVRRVRRWKTRRDRIRAKLREIREELRRRRHHPIPEQGRWLQQVVRGFFNYHAVPTNIQALVVFRKRVTELWRRFSVPRPRFQIEPGKVAHIAGRSHFHIPFS